MIKIMQFGSDGDLGASEILSEIEFEFREEVSTESIERACKVLTEREGYGYWCRDYFFDTCGDLWRWIQREEISLDYDRRKDTDYIMEELV